MKLRHTILSRVRANDGVTLRWIVTTDTGYRAELPVCPCPRIPCTRVPDHPVDVDLPKGTRGNQRRWALVRAREEHDRTHCHARFGRRHKAQAVAFARAVDATYRRKR